MITGRDEEEMAGVDLHTEMNCVISQCRSREDSVVCCSMTRQEPSGVTLRDPLSLVSGIGRPGNPFHEAGLKTKQIIVPSLTKEFSEKNLCLRLKCFSIPQPALKPHFTEQVGYVHQLAEFPHMDGYRRGYKEGSFYKSCSKQVAVVAVSNSVMLKEVKNNFEKSGIGDRLSNLGIASTWLASVLKCVRLVSVDLLACKRTPAGQNSGTSGDADITSVAQDGSTEISQNFASVAQTTTYTVVMTAIDPSSSFVPITLQRDVIVVHRSCEIRNTLIETTHYLSCSPDLCEAGLAPRPSHALIQKNQGFRHHQQVVDPINTDVRLLPDSAELDKQCSSRVRCQNMFTLRGIGFWVSCETAFPTVKSLYGVGCDNASEMSPGSSTESYPAFARIGLRENPGRNLNQVTCPDRDSNPGHLISQPEALTVTPQPWISRNAPIQWSEKSSYLTPLFVWSCVKNKIYSENIPNLVVLKKKGKQATAGVTPDDFVRVWTEIECHYDVCRAVNGAPQIETN
ncbi:hypothetical protein ANN_01477 [Periplaneta americana]|uniref:Uncharacterized protein n=1 Tax=Periplaneta americana TaxID=6978 RepID=A0ABQ8TTP2_PERAM|nr:hypothetical protein ANN_01477 [Periplaneta americana]